MEKMKLEFIYLFIFSFSCLTGICADFDARLQKVARGELKEADAFWWGFNAGNSTSCLQKALNSGVRRLIVSAGHGDWVVEPLQIPSDIEVIFEDGVVLRARRDQFHGKKDALVNIIDRKNVILRGLGKVQFIMNKKDYLDKSKYQWSEWRHCVNIVGSENICLDNLNLLSSGGDGIYIGARPCRNIKVLRVNCVDNNRQGVSITDADGVYFNHCTFRNTWGTPPQCGIDIEPNNKNNMSRNLVFEDCEITDNHYMGVSCYIPSEHPVSALFRNCLIRGNQVSGINLSLTGRGQPEKDGQIRFENCRIENHSREAVGIGQHFRKKLGIVLKNCAIDNRSTTSPAVIIASNVADDVHGIRFEDLKIIDDKNQSPIRFISNYGNSLIDPVMKNITIQKSSGEKRLFDTEKFIASARPDPMTRNFRTVPLDCQNIRALSEKGRMVRQNVRYRGQFEYWIKATRGETIPIYFYHRQVNKYKNTLKIRVISPTHADSWHLKIPLNSSLDYKLTARENGIYRVLVDTGLNTLSISCGAPGQGVTAPQRLYMFLSKGRLYFNVPADVREVALEVSGALYEEADADLLDSNGSCLDKIRNLSGTKILKGKKKNTDRSEIWSVAFKAEKIQLRLRAPVPQFFSDAPENLLAPAGK